MNLALGAFIIIMLLLPGIAFRLGITAAILPKKKKTNNTQIGTKKTERDEHYQQQRYLRLLKFTGVLNTLNFTETLFFFSAIPLVMHLISLLVLSPTLYLLHYEIDFSTLLKILIGKDAISFENSEFVIRVIHFLLYCFIEMILAYVLALFLFSKNNVVKKVASIIGKENPWYTIFVEPFRESSKNEAITLISVDVLVNTKETTVIYSGFMTEFYFKGGTKELEYITLAQPKRLDLRKHYKTVEEGDAKEKVQFFDSEYGAETQIAGIHMVIPGKEILNINTFYWEMKENSQGNIDFSVIAG